MDRREALKALVSLPATTRIRVADLKPNDVIVIECDGCMAQETARHIEAKIHTIWPGRRCVVLSDGLKMRIVAGA